MQHIPATDSVSSMKPASDQAVRHDWTREEAEELFQLPFNDLIFKAQTAHRMFFDANEVQLSNLLSIKTGGCSEDCGYCSQSAQNESTVKAEKLMEVEAVLAEARRAKEGGATRFCMGAAWREPKDRDMDAVTSMIEGVRDLGMETCMTLGMLSDDQVGRLKDAGLDFYNHNIDTSERFYEEIITTHTYQDRLDTLERVRNAGINVCSGGIVGLGEHREDRADMLVELANMDEHPQSVPVNMLVRVEGTPLSENTELDAFEFVRTIAVAKIMMPSSVIRLSAGREYMTDEMQALCFLAGAGSIFVGSQLLTTPNPEREEDDALFAKLGISAAPAEEKRRCGRKGE